MGEAPEHSRRCHTPVTATNDPVRRLDVPHIVAFGRRNAGKSRALEAIASINFPVSFSSSAHYVTELTMSPDPAFRVTASVRLADPGAGVRQLCTGHCLADVQRCLDEARAAFPRTDPEGDLSDSVLEICITGPGLFPLRLVDVPGASFTERMEQVEVQRGWSTAVTTAKVTNIIRGYVKPQNTVILAVVAAEDAARACSDTVTVAARYDPEKRRILGIVTRADGADNAARSSEAYQRLENKLHWGWHLLGGRASTGASVDEAQDPDADDSGIPGPNSGALASLHEALCDLLFHQMQAQIPAVKGSVQASLAERLQSREALGPERPALRDQWFFLVQSAFAFQKLCRDAQQLEYPDDGAAAFFHGDAVQLGRRLRCLARAFGQIVHDYGAVGNTVQDYASYASVPPPSKRLSELLALQPRRPRAATLQHIPLDELHINAKAMAADGGQSPAASARALFRRLAANWNALAWQYVQHALCECRAFVELVFEHLVPAYGHTRDLLVARFVEPFFEECEEALAAKVDELAEPYEKGYCSLSELTISDGIAAKKVRKKCDCRSKKAPSATATGLYHGDDKPAPSSILDMAQGYYDESRATFTDNVVSLAVERCLVQRIGTLFTPEMVRGMSDEEVAEIASESPHAQAQRKLLEQQIETLTSELDYWHRVRPTKAHFNLVLPSEFQASSALADTMEPAPVK